MKSWHYSDAKPPCSSVHARMKRRSRNGLGDHSLHPMRLYGQWAEKVAVLARDIEKRNAEDQKRLRCSHETICCINAPAGRMRESADWACAVSDSDGPRHSESPKCLSETVR